MAAETSIWLNDELIFSENLQEIADSRISDPQVPDWEKELFAFLKEWFSATDQVQVQTSGSTGKPQTITLPKAVMRKSALRTIDFFGLQKNDRLLLNLPCRFIAGKMMVVRAIVGKMNLIAIDPADGAHPRIGERFALGAMVPNQVYGLLESTSGKEKLQQIQNLLVGGSAISAGLEEQIQKLSNRIVSTYGMTETATHIAIRELNGANRSEFYHCLPGITVDVNEAGCLRVHLPESSEPLQTSDLAQVASSGSFRILGRADSVIISGGIKFVPEELEQKIGHLLDRRFVFSALNDEKLGEKLVLVIEGRKFETAGLEAKINEILTVYERPKAYIFVRHFPETGHSKLSRVELKQQIQNFG